MEIQSTPAKPLHREKLHEFIKEKLEEKFEHFNLSFLEKSSSCWIIINKKEVARSNYKLLLKFFTKDRLNDDSKWEYDYYFYFYDKDFFNEVILWLSLWETFTREDDSKIIVNFCDKAEIVCYVGKV